MARKLREVLGADAGEDLVNWMDEISATRADIAELRHATETGFLRLEAKIEALGGNTNTDFERMRAHIAEVKADLMKWSFVFWVGAVAAIAALAGVLRN